MLKMKYFQDLCSFCNISVTSPTSQLILQPFRRFTYVTAHSPTLPLLHLRHSSFSNPSFASPTSQVLHLIHLVSRPCHKQNTVLFLTAAIEGDLKYLISIVESTAVGQAAACAPVMQRARVRSPVRTGFSGFFLTCKTNIGKLQAPKVPEYHLAIVIIITQHSLRAPMT